VAGSDCKEPDRHLGLMIGLRWRVATARSLTATSA